MLIGWGAVVERAFASSPFTVEPLSVLTHMMDEREIPHPAGPILSLIDLAGSRAYLTSALSEAA